MWADQNSNRTLELRDVIASGVNIWDFEYPSYYKGDQKAAFEQKVIDHFLLRQIGSETVGRFLHYFRRTVREIMPYYIQRYESVDMMKDPEIRPLDNYNMIEEYEDSGSTEATGNSSGNGSREVDNRSKQTQVHSDTPQGKLNLTLQADGVAETIDLASDVTQEVRADHTGESSSASEEMNQTGSSESRHKLTRRGNIGVTTYAQLLEGYRQTFLNIDMEVINELEPCFLGVF